MSDKWNRIKALATGAENKVKDESLRDTLKDMANYCLMTLIEIEIQEYASLSEQHKKQIFHRCMSK